MAKTLSSIDELRTVEDQVRELVQVPEWDMQVWIRGITGRERDSYEQSLIIGKGKNRDVSMHNARAKLLVRAVVDEDGNRVFRDADAEELGQRNAAALDKLASVAMRLSGLSDTDMDELVEDFGQDRNGASTST